MGLAPLQARINIGAIANHLSAVLHQTNDKTPINILGVLDLRGDCFNSPPGCQQPEQLNISVPQALPISRAPRIAAQG